MAKRFVLFCIEKYWKSSYLIQLYAQFPPPFALYLLNGRVIAEYSDDTDNCKATEATQSMQSTRNNVDSVFADCCTEGDNRPNSR